MPQNIFAWWPTISEKEPTTFYEEPNDNHDLNDKTSSQDIPPETQEKNKKRWKELFYKKDQIADYIHESSPDDVEQNLALFESESWQEALDKVLCGFELDTPWESLEEIFDVENVDLRDERARCVDQALNSAFVCQAEREQEWKKNTSKEVIQGLVSQMKEWNPFQKLQFFMEIIGLLNTTEWSRWNRQKKLYEQFQERKEEYAQKLEKEFDDTQAKLLAARDSWNKVKINEYEGELEELRKEMRNHQPTWWEVMSGWSLDSLVQGDFPPWEQTA